MTGLTTYNGTPDALQLLVTQQTTTVILPAGLQFDLVLPQAGQATPISGIWQAYNSVTLVTGFESGTGFSAEVIAGTGTPGSLESIVEGITVNRNPIPPNAGFMMLTQTHYDNYNDLPASFYTTTLNPSGYSTYLDAAAGDYPEPLTIAKSLNDKVTWVKDKVLGENKYIISSNLYDEKGRLLQLQTLNYTGAMDVVTNQYSFSGQLLRSHFKHEKGGANAQSVDLATKNSYDDLGRLVSVAKNLNGGSWKEIATMTYDALGQQKTRKLSPAFNNGAGLETLTYDYNIRGWMLGANRDYTKSTAGVDHYFGFDLGYDKQAITSLGSYDEAQYNGDIAGTVWKSKGDGEVRKYDFSYDAINRLTKADFNQYNSGFNKTAGIDFTVSDLTYDANGNILTQKQMGLNGINSDYIDKLTYKYYENGYSNRLLNVVDDINNTQTTLGDFRSSQKYMTELNNVKTDQAVDYDYDVNGNLKFDQNKDIESITYNHLNLPQMITIEGNKGSIEYVYDASGNKIKKTVHETGKPDKTTLYLFGVYEDDVLQFLPMDDGRIRPVRDGNGVIASFTYDYFLKDHLGNVRMVLTEEQKMDPYQAGMEDAARSYEVALFGDKVNSTATDKPAGFDGCDENKKVSVLNGTLAENRIGPGVILKVMAGDKITARTNAWYQPSNVDNSTQSGLVGIVENLLAQLVPGVSAAKGVAGGQITNNMLRSGMENFLGTQNLPSGLPKAYLNWVLLDEKQFKMVDGGVTPVKEIVAGDPAKLLEANNGNEIAMKANGYLYVFVSNESKSNVYFDDIRVEHIHGPLLEETHYYPFGLTMAGISSKAIKPGYSENKRKYNGIEQTTDLNLNEYDAFYRNLDPQIGRWWQIDPKIEDGMQASSPYNSMYDDPILKSDPLGDKPEDDYRIKLDGSIEVLKTSDKFDRFFVQTSDAAGSDLVTKDETGTTNYSLVATLGKNDAGLVQFPAEGNGFSRYGDVQSPGVVEVRKGGKVVGHENVGTGDHWVKPEAAAAIFGLVGAMKSVGVKDISFGDMSTSNGSDPGSNTFHHKSHGHNGVHVGTETDFRYIGKSGRSIQSSNAFVDKRYSGTYNNALYSTARRFGFTHNGQGPSGNIPATSKWGGHDNHGHIGVTLSAMHITISTPAN
jgi:RHS repeat-associated protein